MISHYWLQDDQNDITRIKERYTDLGLWPKSEVMPVEQLKLPDTEIEFVRSAELLDDGPAYGVPRPASSFKKASSFLSMVPDEILGEIFVACLPHWDVNYDWRCHDGGLSTMDRTRAPWVLTQICSEWRFIALSLPRLWSRIAISPISPTSELNIKTILLSLEISLLRSANAPLCFLLQDRTRAIRLYEEPWVAILDALMRHSERWQNANILLESIQIKQLARIKGRVPSLRRVKVTIFGNDVQRIGMALDMFALAPVLHHFEVVGNGAVKPVCPWPQLTYYGGESTAAEAQVELLHEMPSLVHASFDLRRAVQGTPFASHCTHTHLRSLSIAGSVNVLDGLTLPALRTLSVSSYMPLTPIVPFIQRSSCTLTNLTFSLRNQQTGVTDMIAIFEATPALTSLSVTDYSPTMEDIMSHLKFNQSDTEPRLLTKLQKLYYQPVYIHCGLVDQLIEMIESRWKVQPSFPADRIHSVCLHVGYRNVKNTMSLLSTAERLREEGLDIMII